MTFASCRNWNVEEFIKRTPDFNTTVRDIEDLVKFGETRTLCPYFLSREMAASADVVFMPYNYLVDVKTRGKLGISWKNAVLIFDEAHNVEVSFLIVFCRIAVWAVTYELNIYMLLSSGGLCRSRLVRSSSHCGCWCYRRSGHGG